MVKSFFIKLLSPYISNKQILTKNKSDFIIRYSGFERKRCKHGVTIQESKNQDPTSEKQENKKDVTDLLRFIVDASQKRQLRDDEIKRAIKLLSNRIMIFRYINDKKETRYFESNTKGTNRYNKKLSSKIKDFTAAVCSNGTETFALTITCDPKKYGNNRFLAWKNYTKDINLTLENLRKHRGLKYVWVKESTKKGYPHAHIVLSFPKGFCKYYSKLQNAKKIIYGDFYNYIKKNVVAPVFELQAIKGNNLKYYLTKYISKGEGDDIYRLGKKEEPLTAAERKEALSFLMTTITKTRLCGFCKLKEMSKQNTSRTDAERYQKHLRKHALKELRITARERSEREHFASLRALLIKLCINSPFTCCKNIYAVQKNTFEKQISADIDEDFIKSEEKQRKYDCMSKRVTCNGCIFSDLVNFINGDKKSVFNLKIGIDAKDKSDVYLFDKIDKNNDKEYIYAIANVMDVLQRLALISRTDILTALENEERKQFVFSQNDFIFSYIKRFCYYGDYPNYIKKQIVGGKYDYADYNYTETIKDLSNLTDEEIKELKGGQKTNGSRQKKKNNTFGDTQRQFEF